MASSLVIFKVFYKMVDIWWTFGEISLFQNREKRTFSAKLKKCFAFRIYKNIKIKCRLCYLGNNLVIFDEYRIKYKDEFL